MKLNLFGLLAAVVVSSTNAVVPPGADTPAFYLVSSSGDSNSNLLPLRTNGGAGGYASLSGSGPIGQFFFFQGQLTAAPIPGSTSNQRPLIGFLEPDCTLYGPLGFAGGSDTDKCALFGPFGIESDPENSQLGAMLTFNWAGGFYACATSNGQDVWYQPDPNNGPAGLSCTPIDLWTVPVY